MATLDEHLQQPGISIEQHIAARAQDLASSLAGKIPVYLDMRFWVLAREVRHGVRHAPSDRKLVHHLERLVGRGRIFCPIAEPTFTELIKQGNVEQRVRTAEVIRDLSNGVSLLPDDVRLPAEARHLLLERLLGQTSPRPIPWTSIAFVLGNAYAARTAFAAIEERAVQKAFYDRQWDTSVIDIVEMLDADAYSSPDERQAEADRLNALNVAHRSEMKSFAWVLEREFEGVAEICARSLPDLAAMLAPYASSLTAETWKIWASALKALLGKEEEARLLPGAHIHAVIHALFRWEYRDKQITPNDLVDFRHATAALGHCEALFTENELRRTLCHRRLSLQEFHGRFVTSDVNEAISYLRRLS